MLTQTKFAELEELFEADTYGDWFTTKCFVEARGEQCWCAVIGLVKYPDFDDATESNGHDHTYVAGSGSIPKYFAKLAVESRNAVPLLMKKLEEAEAVIRSLSGALSWLESAADSSLDYGLKSLDKELVKEVEVALNKSDNYQPVTKSY